MFRKLLLVSTMLMAALPAYAQSSLDSMNPAEVLRNKPLDLGSASIQMNGGALSGASVALPTSAPITAAGTTQSTATVLNMQNNVVTTVAAGTGVLVQASPFNIIITILNRGANSLLIYPAVGAQFEDYAVNEAVSLAAGATLHVVMISETQGYVF